PRKLGLGEENADIAPVPVSAGGRKAAPELARLSNILNTCNDRFGTLFTDADRVRRYISEDIGPRGANDRAYQNARKNSGQQNARIEHDKPLLRVVSALRTADTDLFKQYEDNESLQRWLANTGCA